MKTLAELRAYLKELLTKQESLLADENGFTDEVEAEVRKIGDEITATEKAIDDVLQKEEKRTAAIKALEERKAQVGDILTRSKTISIEVRKKPLEHVLRNEFGEEATLGKYLQCIARHRIDGNDPQFQKVQREVRAATGMSVQSNEDGGFLVGVTDGGFMSEKSYEESIFAKRCTQAKLDPGTRSIKYNRYKGRSRKDGYRHGGFIAKWEGEGESIDATRLKYEMQTLNVHSLRATVPVTNDLLNNAAGLESEIRSFAPKSFAFEIDRALFEGSGAGQPFGIKSSGIKLTIAKESGQAAATILLDNVIKMEARSATAQALYFANQDVLPQLMKLKYEDNSPAFLPVNQGATEGVRGYLFGRPIVYVEHCETLGTEGDLLLADWGAYRLLDPGAMRVDGSMHVYFLTDEYAFRFIRDVGGAPMFDVPITPLKGTNTLSEFITLATRS